MNYINVGFQLANRHIIFVQATRGMMLAELV